MHTMMLVLAGFCCLASTDCPANGASKCVMGTNTDRGGVSVVNDSSWKAMTSAPLDEAEKALAADAELAFLRRINGEAANIFDDSFFQGLKCPLYVIADQKFELPTKRPPEFRMAKDMEELKRIARETKQDAYYVHMESSGMAEFPDGTKGVVIQYGYSVVDWERATWDALSEAERAANPEPKFRMWLFGGGYRVCVTRGAQESKLVFHEEPMVVS